MFDFFYKYNKFILAVGGSILMVLFLLPNLVPMMQNSGRNPVLGNADGQEILASDTHNAQAELEVLNSLGIGAPDLGREGGLTWVLLLKEAQEQGLSSSRLSAESVLASVKAQVDPQRLYDLKRQLNVSDAFLLQTFRHLLMVQELQRLMQDRMTVPMQADGKTQQVNIPRVSDQRVRHLVSDLYSKVTVRAIAIPASTQLASVPEPQPDELQRRFEYNKGVDAGSPQSQYGFGYMLPNRFKLSYLEVPLEAVRATVQVTEIETSRYYQEHKDRFMDPIEPEKPEGDAAPDATSTQPKEDTPQKFRLRTYEEARDTCFQALKEDKAAARMQEIMQWIQSAANEKLRALPMDTQSDYRVIPENEKPIDFEDLARRVQDRFGILPRVVKLDDKWLTFSDINGIENLGQAYLFTPVNGQGQIVPLGYYIASAREFNPSAEALASNPLAMLRLQAKIPSRPIKDFNGNEFIFQLLATSPRHIPDSISDVQDEVTKDVKLLKAYTAVQDKVKNDYLPEAQAKGLDALAESLSGALNEKFDVLSPGEFSRKVTVKDQNEMIASGGQVVLVPDVEGVGRAEAFVNAAYDLAKKVEAAGGLDHVAGEARFTIADVDHQLTVYVIELVDYEPATTADYDLHSHDALRAIELQDLVDWRRHAPTANPFAQAEVAKRVGYVSEMESKKSESGDDNKEKPEETAP